MAKRKGSRGGRIFFTLLLIAALCGACFSGYMLFSELSEYSSGKAAYKKIDGMVIRPEEPDGEKQIDFDGLRQINSDLAGWIELADSAISYPVVYSYNQPTDWYLDHLFDGEYNRSGCIFLDENNMSTDDAHLVFYGHHMRNGTMFADVQKYESQDWYDSHRTIEFTTPEGKYILYPFAGIFTTGTDAYVRTGFADEADFMNYVQYFISGSTFVSDTVPVYGDRTALLSTCSYNVEDGRYALLCKVEKAG